MQSTIKDFFIGHGSSRSITRSPAVTFAEGSAAVNKLPEQLLCYTKLQNSKKYRKCDSRRCLTCPMAAEGQIASGNISEFLFCKSLGIVYLIFCSECGLCYVGQTGTELNKRINNHRSAIKKILIM